MVLHLKIVVINYNFIQDYSKAPNLHAKILKN